MPTSIRALFLIVGVLVAAPASAQVCRGGVPFGPNPYQVAGTASFTDGARAVGGDFSVGNRYVFAGAGFTSRHVDAADGSEAGIVARGGVEAPISRDGRMVLCPIGFIGFGSGPDIGETDVSAFRIGIGARVGVAVHDTPDLMIVPTFGIDAVRERRALEFGGIEQESTDGFGVAALGVGVIINRRLAITPEVGVPFSAADSDVTFLVRVAFGFGG